MVTKMLLVCGPHSLEEISSLDIPKSIFCFVSHMKESHMCLKLYGEWVGLNDNRSVVFGYTIPDQID